MNNAALTRNGFGPLDQSRIPRPDITSFPPEQPHVTQRSHFEAMHDGQAQVPTVAAYSNLAVELEHEQNGGELVPLEYMGVASSQKKRTPRTMMACDACRAAKAKCTDPKPCQGCTDKDIECKFPEPAQKPADRAQSDILTRIGDLVKEVQRSGGNVVLEIKELRLEISRLHDRQRVIEKGLCPANPGLSALLNHYDAAANVPPGEPAIPHGHTTGAAKILEWQAVAAMVGEKMKRDKNGGMNPMERERKRGVIRLYGRGEARPEGNGRSLGTEMDSISDYGFEPPRSSSDTYSDPAHSPTIEQVWSQGGAQSPVSDSFLFRAESDARAAVDMRGLPSLDIETVRYLAGIYMRHLNVMHPIITPKSLEIMIAKFMQSIGGDGAGCNNFATFAGSSDATGTKRKRSPTASGADYASFDQLGHGLRQRTISEGIVLLILALGKICERQTKIPDVVPDNDGSTTNSPANYASPLLMHQSPQMSSHSSTLPSPIIQDRAHNRRSSTGVPSAQYPPGTRNVDVIPGLAYFAAGMEILGNYIGGTGLPYVHAYLLAGLYHGQLGRVLQSHACIKEAGYALSIMLKPHLERYQKMQEEVGNTEPNVEVKWLPGDNHTLFTFWTCLQLESDIVAELEVPQSDILMLESVMPWPNLSLAEKNGEITDEGSCCYFMQVLYRKKLNVIHRELYGPGKENEYQLEEMNKILTFPYINAIIKDLESLMDVIPNLVWYENDSPSSNILNARLRAKKYGAEVITTRHFLRMVLNSRYDGNGNMEISEPIMEFAQKCIRAMFNSAQAFWGMGEGRLVVTNVWGTSHAQWGHVVVLHAAYKDPRLRPYVSTCALFELTVKVRQFLVSVAHPSSALADDIRILDYATEASGLREDFAAMSREESRGGSGGGAGSSFASNGSDMGAVAWD
ncbi:hypothetical protein V493_01039 [Pseudogymnoascus sp. VKM F-4281 (FW-2241)]|nr:hypothetical protein V493_01039 [Pseudogymnoascus sp. VKM F-4281 (FW-2241)]